MPNRPLIPNQENLQLLKKWLNENINEKKRIKACCKEVKNVSQISDKKGLYFWFMHQSCYRKLRNVKPLESIYPRTINGEIFHLVYTGTAGVRNNSNGENSGNLTKRIKWHLCENKSISALCSGHMSTFRRTIGSLMADDLIENNIQDKIDELFCNNFFIYYLEYPGTFKQVKSFVNTDESVIIDLLRPIFNLAENPNKDILGHITNQIQQRRQMVENASKRKWCNGKKAKRQKGYSSKNLSHTKIQKKSIPKLLIESTDKCLSFNVKVNESIHDVINLQPNLPYPCKFICTDSLNKNQIIYKSKNNQGWRTTGRKGSQNIYEYFNNSDTNYAKRNGFNFKSRWEIVQQEMKEKRIKKITVTICPD
jgi:hypothetical protein